MRKELQAYLDLYLKNQKKYEQIQAKADQLRVTIHKTLFSAESAEARIAAHHAAVSMGAEKNKLEQQAQGKRMVMQAAAHNFFTACNWILQEAMKADPDTWDGLNTAHKRTEKKVQDLLQCDKIRFDQHDGGLSLYWFFSGFRYEHSESWCPLDRTEQRTLGKWDSFLSLEEANRAKFAEPVPADQIEKQVKAAFRAAKQAEQAALKLRADVSRKAGVFASLGINVFPSVEVKTRG